MGKFIGWTEGGNPEGPVTEAAVLRRILFPTDFSTFANTVFDCLPALKTIGVEEVVLANIIRTGDALFAETYNREAFRYIYWSVTEQLNVQRMGLEGYGLKVLTRIGYGNPGSELAQIAEEDRVDLIVIGAQGTSLGSELMMGSTAFEIIRKAPVPVLLFQAEAVRSFGHIQCRWNCAKLFQKILHPTDFSTCADQAWNVLVNLLSGQTQEVMILHVQDERVMKHRPAAQLADFDRIDQDRLRERCQQVQEKDVRVRALIRRGIPFRETLRVAEEEKVTLIILGSRGRSAVQELITGSTLENVARLSQLPVLIVRSGCS